MIIRPADPNRDGAAILAIVNDAIVEEGRARDNHVMIGGVDAANEASLAFHRAAGFEEAGRLREVGWKFGRWLDLVFMHKRL